MRWERFVQGLGNGAKFLGRMFPPNFAADKLALLRDGMIESLQIAVIATLVGIALALPVGLLGARNLVPRPVAWVARGLIIVCRTYHPIIVAILFVKAVGFGALAGVLALVVATAINSGTARVEDPVEATLARAVSVGGAEVLPAGSTLNGTVAAVAASGKIKGLASITLHFTSVATAGRDDRYDVDATYMETAEATKSSASSIARRRA